MSEEINSGQGPVIDLGKTVVKSSRSPRWAVAAASIGLGVLVGMIAATAALSGAMYDEDFSWLSFVVVVLALGLVGWVGWNASRKSIGLLVFPWPQLALGAFGFGVLFTAVAAILDVRVVNTLLSLFSQAALVCLIIGALALLILNGKRDPAGSDSVRLVAPIVGHTADGQPVYGPAVQTRSTNVVAVLALVFGIFGGLLGIVFGHVALSQINRSGEDGREIAVAGLVLGYLSIIVWIAIFASL